MYSTQKKNFKNSIIFSFLIFSFLIFNETVKAQNPVSFTVNSCVADGDYIQAEDVNGCPCYERVDGGLGIIGTDGASWIHDDAHSDCADFGDVSGDDGNPDGGDTGGGDGNPDGGNFAPTEIYTYVDCNILNATADSCDPANISNVDGSGDVPTLSEWGLIILALLLMSLGTIAILQRKPNKIEGN